MVNRTVGTSANTSLVSEMSDQAADTLKPDERPMIQSDEGYHCRPPGWIERVGAGLREAGSRKGCVPDDWARGVS